MFSRFTLARAGGALVVVASLVAVPRPVVAAVRGGGLLTPAPVAVVGSPCGPSRAVDDGGRPLTCASTAIGRLWVWSSPIPSSLDSTAPVPTTWATVVPSLGGSNADAPSPALPGQYVNRAAMEARLIDIMNGERAALGLRPLVVDPRLTRLSRWWAEHTTDAAYAGRGTAHCPPTLCGVRAAEVGYPSFGEVIRAWNPFPKGDMAAERFFLDSPRHMAIINNPKVTHIGFGVFIVGDPSSPQSIAVVGQVGRSR